MGLIITALTTKYRDLAFLVSFGVQLLMYGTTVIYPLSSIAPRFRTLILLNPMTGIIESIRYGLLGKGYLTFNTILYATAVTVLTLAAGILIFNKTEKNFIDTV